MLVGPMKRRIFLAGIVGFMIMFLIAGALGIFGYSLYAKKNDEIAKLKSSKKEVYIINREISSTEQITMSDVTKKTIDIESIPNGAFETIKDIEDFLGKETYAKIDLKKDMVLTKEMTYNDENKITPDVRVQELNMVLLPSQLEEGDYVDIRFRLPTGNDYVAVSYARVAKVTQQTVWLNLNEVERLRISSAIIESYLTQGSLLYAIEYSDAPNQTPAKITYDVLASVMNVLLVSPNITEEIDFNNQIKLDDNYTERRLLFDAYVAPYLVINTEDEPRAIQERLEFKVSEQIRIQQEERAKKLETDAAAVAAAQAAAANANTGSKKQ